MKSFSAIVVLFFCLCVQLHALRPINTGIIEKTCAQTKDTDLCVSTLSSDPNSFTADVTGLALISLRLASSNASDISESIKVMFNDSRMVDPAVQQGLFDCLDQFVDASQQLDDAIAAVTSKAYADVETWVKVAIADAETCRASFGAEPSVLSHKNRVFIKLCNNALVISRLAASARR